MVMHLFVFFPLPFTISISFDNIGLNYLYLFCQQIGRNAPKADILLIFRKSSGDYLGWKAVKFVKKYSKSVKKI